RVATVRQSYQQIRRDLGLRRDAADDGSAEEERQNFGLALIAGYFDRVARRRKPGARDLILSTGHVAQQAEESVAKSANLLLALDAEDRAHAPVALQRGEKRAPRHGIRVRIAEPIEAEWLLEQASAELTEKEELAWDEGRERVQLTSSLCWGAVV